MLGLVMVLSASRGRRGGQRHSPYQIFNRQAMWAAIGWSASSSCCASPRVVRRLADPAAACSPRSPCSRRSCPGVGTTSTAPRAWIRSATSAVQPSEFLKLAVVLFAADLLVRRQDDAVGRPPQPRADRAARRLRRRRLPRPGRPRLGDRDDGDRARASRSIGGVPLLADARHDGRCRPRRPLAVRVLEPSTATSASPRSSTSPEKPRPPRPTSLPGLLAIADGGLTGSGVGAGNGKLGYLPLAHSDFIFAVDRRRARLRRHASPSSAASSCSCGSASRRRCRRPDRFGMLLAGGIIDVVRRAGDRQPRRRGRSDAGDRADAAVLLRRRIVAVRVAWWPPGCCSTSPAGVADREPTPSRRDGCRRDVLRRRHRRRHGRSRAAGARRRRGPRGRRPRRRDDPLRRHRARHRDATAAADAVSRTRSSTSSACSAALDSPQPRRSRPSCYRATRRAGALLAPPAAAGGGLGRRLRQPARGAGRPARSASPSSSSRYDRRPGRASAVAARFAAACAVAYPGSPLPRAEVTGAPVRRAILAVDRGDRPRRRPRGPRAARRPLRRGGDGGSLGSGVLNEAIRGYVADRRDDAGLAVRQVVGERFAADGRPVGRDDPTACSTRPSATRPRMDLLYAAADLLVGRGGASTVAEVAVTGTPAVLVPWSGAAEDHQTANVALARRPGRGRRCCAESDIDRLGAVIDGLRADAVRRDGARRRAPCRRGRPPQRSPRPA